jgi:hypothetical protein
VCVGHGFFHALKDDTLSPALFGRRKRYENFGQSRKGRGLENYDGTPSALTLQATDLPDHQ